MPDHPRIFVSHSQQDDEWCRAFVGALQAAGWDVWYDAKGPGGGASWVATIQRELRAREVFLLVLSPDAWASRWVREELDLAFVTHRHIIPVHHRPTQADGPILERPWVHVVGIPGANAARMVIGLALSRLPAPDAPATAAPSTQAESPLPSIREEGRRLGPSPAPDGAEPVPHLTSTSLYTLGFRGYVIDGVGCVLPPLCPVPAGAFPMGSDKTRDQYARPKEMPQCPVLVGDFAIGQHLVTVAEYACAVRAGSVREPPRIHAGVDWPWPQQLQHLDHPVVCVDWEDALAYVRWLAEVTGQPWRLPTEAEWEMAARGPDGRIYPWGDAFDTTRCNTNESGIGTTSPVGTYPDGASPYGAQDMAGNVWEWTCSHYKAYAYDQHYRTEDLDTPGTRVLRGGSWGDAPNSRARGLPQHRPSGQHPPHLRVPGGALCGGWFVSMPPLTLAIRKADSLSPPWA
jgi:hypothetical protein